MHTEAGAIGIDGAFLGAYSSSIAFRGRDHLFNVARVRTRKLLGVIGLWRKVLISIFLVFTAFEFFVNLKL